MQQLVQRSTQPWRRASGRLPPFQRRATWRQSSSRRWLRWLQWSGLSLGVTPRLARGRLCMWPHPRCAPCPHRGLAPRIGWPAKGRCPQEAGQRQERLPQTRPPQTDQGQEEAQGHPRLQAGLAPQALSRAWSHPTMASSLCQSCRQPLLLVVGPGHQRGRGPAAKGTWAMAASLQGEVQLQRTRSLQPRQCFNSRSCVIQAARLEAHLWLLGAMAKGRAEGPARQGAGPARLLGRAQAVPRQHTRQQWPRELHGRWTR